MTWKKGENGSDKQKRGAAETNKTEYEKEQDDEVRKIRMSEWGKREARGQN